MTPVPEAALAHCAALLPHVDEAVSYFLTGLEDRFNVLDTNELRWTALAYPRPCTYADLTLGDWQWRIIVDPNGATEALRAALEACDRTHRVHVASGPWGPEATDNLAQQALEAHQASVMVFVTDAPDSATPLEIMRSLARVGWAWLDAGALMLAFPEGRTAWDPDYLKEFRPSALGPEEAGLFVSYGSVELLGETLTRTYGLGQFQLPDLIVTEADPPLMNALIPHLVKREGDLAAGDRISVQQASWKVATRAMPAEGASLSSRHGLVALLKDAAQPAT